MTVYVSQNLGVCAYRRIRKGVGAGTAIGVVTSLVIGAAMLLFGRAIPVSYTHLACSGRARRCF